MKLLKIGIKISFWIMLAAAIPLSAILIDRHFGKGSGIIVFHLIGGALSFILVTPILIFILLPPLKKLLGPASNDLASDSRISMWLELSELFKFQNSNHDEVMRIAKSLRSLGVKQDLAKTMIETEVGPVCGYSILKAGDDYYDGIDNWNKDWLIRKILNGSPAYKFIRRIPIVGFYWSVIVTMVRRENIQLLLSELNFPYDSEQ